MEVLVRVRASGCLRSHVSGEKKIELFLVLFLGAQKHFFVPYR